MEFYSVVKKEDKNHLVADIVEFECGQICIYWYVDESILVYPSIEEFWNDYIQNSNLEIFSEGVKEDYNTLIDENI